MITEHCVICGNTFKIFPCRKGVNKYCSKECGKIGKTKELREKQKLAYKRRWVKTKGRVKNTNGYMEININALSDEDKKLSLMMIPSSNKKVDYRRSLYIREHRLVMAKKIKRPLYSNEVVHHKNGIKDDNRIENLELLNFSTHCNANLSGKMACPRCSYKF